MLSERIPLARLEREFASLMPPALPRPVPPLRDPAYLAWRAAFQEYAERRETLRVEILARKEGRP
jgi:hypothetical protein